MKIKSDNEKLNAVLSEFYKVYREVRQCADNDHEYTTDTGNGVNACECFTILDSLRIQFNKALK